MAPFLSIEQTAQLSDAVAQSGSSGYLNLSKIKGTKRIRFVGPGQTGYLGWTDDGPIRFRQMPSEVPESVTPDRKGRRSLSWFICGVVWDYDEETFKICEISQKSVIKALEGYMSDEDYGDPNGYDLKITREEGSDFAKYVVLPTPPSSTAKHIVEGYKSLKWNLDALYDNGDPFAG